MKKVLMCILFNLLGMGAILCAVFMSDNDVSLFWVVVMYVLAGCLMISPYKAVFAFGVCLTMVFGGLIVAGALWFGMDGMSGFGPIPMSLSLSGAGGMCMILPFLIGAVMELVCGKDQLEEYDTPGYAAIGILVAVVLALVTQFVIYPLVF